MTVVAGLERLERHAEQIEHLEDLVGELILTVESLRRVAADLDPSTVDSASRTTAT